MPGPRPAGSDGAPRPDRTARDAGGEGGGGRVLIIEDDPTVAEVAGRYLERDGYLVEWEQHGTEGLERALATEPDLIVLDLMLPGTDGLEVCRRVRETLPVPVIILTALGDESDRVMGLELGADDYLTKPFSPRELVARVRAVLRRATAAVAPPPGSELIETGRLTIDRAGREVRRDGDALALTAMEFDLLAFLAARPGEAFPREQLLEEVWGYTYGDAATVTVHIRRLRTKIEDDPSAPTLIATVWGVGYRWDG